MSRALSTPAFGEADLSNCEREQIHLAGSIQPHGVLLLLHEPDLIIVQASENTAALLGLDASPIGRSLEELGGDLADQFRLYAHEAAQSAPIAMRCTVGGGGADYDGLVHRSPNGGLIIELEPTGDLLDWSRPVADAMETIVASPSLRGLCDETAKIFKSICGYDRVMVYRFDEHGHGEVFAEQREPELEAFLGNRYPASDIPQMARRLYVRNRVRVLVDVAYEPVGLNPRLSPITGQDLDMSLCALRSMSPIHIQYLKNMGVAATLVASLVVEGKLWGLVSCHHYKPRFVQFEIRSVCELLAEAVATRIAALESFLQSQAELSVRRLEQRMIESIGSEGDWRGALFDSPTALLQPLGAGGAALLFDGQILTAGEVPGTREVRELGRWLDAQPRSPVIGTASLGLDAPQFSLLTQVASGLLAAPVSNSPGEYLLWFRPELIRTITWGGNPFKPVVIGDDPRDLSPRRSFSQWHQLMEGSSEPWTAADLAAARLIGATVADVILQFRSVQMLILQDQLDQVRRHVHVSEQPVVIADETGRILLINDAFERLMPSTHVHLEWLDDLTNLFAEPAEVRRRLSELVTNRRTWRGEIYLETSRAGALPMLIRADPVFATVDRVRGFVVLLSDNTEQKEAAAARLRFQEGIIERHRLVAGQIGSKTDLAYQNLMSAVVENAQLAALEITDRADVESMPEMLESVRVSVARTAEVLEHLIWHARRGSKP
ncbi:GAF domain-containing protein [Phenylobacterium sp.]|uniref:GAF domain-containing protein n=1 Tax=Phenylobacterium sp. TaxID=1871053 RepID=UPI0025E87284|nr:GAF domain-containing protein [Phenylobacterium sp.]